MNKSPEPPENPSNMLFEVAPHVWGLKILFVNVYFVQNPHDHTWVLIDAGLPGSASSIQKAAQSLFGNQKPECIVMTHGHFDHRGALPQLLKTWEVPLYAHPLELPYLDGRSAYPPADPTVGGGMMAWMSFTYPRAPYDLSGNVKALPEDGSVPGLPEWRWVHSPGHSPGHVSLWRALDRTLIAGDAVVTTQQESAYHALTYAPKLSGPPKYFKPMQGEQMSAHLQELARNFEQQAVPNSGRYVDDPATATEQGTQHIPPLKREQQIKLLGMGMVALGALWGIKKVLGSKSS
ncbi:MBL fold metallo-hydrolase [Deinococcus misasensis]|uniref:MBL fold metallo-hydrolase n=1 Tax=Deinococcus misasensis TaxID=392413 RepID=UPI0012F7CFA4|nr:MBL fold metallo-hydrolase [Deinococcus misasensis]